jgi:hypothetical protein
MADATQAKSTPAIPSAVQAKDPKQSEFVPYDKRTPPIPSAVEPAKKGK